MTGGYAKINGRAGLWLTAEHRGKKMLLASYEEVLASINQAEQKVSGTPLYIASSRTLAKCLIVVTIEKPGSMIDDYGKRCSIETMFGNIKSWGFDLEPTHMMNIVRMDKLMSY
ncbi:MAG: hypothetical protein QS721_00250 [Candidatus Endonucleobacter sp. (ex Gigantidas childressi)]|nr:hypothetical protein [Candidatus Endonucleobacter sp. (ex Gigantidas childressi)]